MAELNPYDRLPGEGESAWTGFICYRNQGVGRTFLKAYLEYMEKRGKAFKSGKKPNTIPGSFKKWTTQWEWIERCKPWDDETEARERELRVDAEGEAYLKEIGTFRDLQIREGKSTVIATIAAKKLLSKFLVDYPAIETLKEAESLARICKLLEGGAEVWARGLAINELLEGMVSGKE
jgi:hypothetical protein